jgi:hypothetical protein
MQRRFRSRTQVLLAMLPLAVAGLVCGGCTHPGVYVCMHEKEEWRENMGLCTGVQVLELLRSTFTAQYLFGMSHFHLLHAFARCSCIFRRRPTTIHQAWTPLLVPVIDFRACGRFRQRTARSAWQQATRCTHRDSPSASTQLRAACGCAGEVGVRRAKRAMCSSYCKD